MRFRCSRTQLYSTRSLRGGFMPRLVKKKGERAIKNRWWYTNNVLLLTSKQSYLICLFFSLGLVVFVMGLLSKNDNLAIIASVVALLSFWIGLILTIIFVNVKVKLRLIALHIGILWFLVGIYLEEAKGASVGELLMALGFILFIYPPVMVSSDFRLRMLDYINNYSKSKKNKPV